MSAWSAAAVVHTTMMTVTTAVMPASMTAAIYRDNSHRSNWYDSYGSNRGYLYNADWFVKTAVVYWP